jgi:thioredoxin-related protein
LVFAFLAGMTVLFIYKDTIVNKLSDASAKAIMAADSSGSRLIYGQFNLEKQGSGLAGSLLEFGAKNCSACRRMEGVLDEIKEQYKNTLSVHFYNVTERDGMELGRQFGVVMIPMQVLLDKNGRVIYKHVGYISASELAQQINQAVLNK